MPKMERDEETVEMMDTEFAHKEETEGGWAMWSKIKGLRASSTRAELVALIIALTVPRAVHIASDSRAAVDKFMRMVGIAKAWNECSNTEWWPKKNPFGKPWGLQPDGDLWKRVWEGMLASG